MAALDSSHSSTAHSVWSPDPHANPWAPPQTSLGVKSLSVSTTFQLVLSTLKSEQLYSQFSSVPQSCLILCNPITHSTPGLPVHHQLPESTQTHVHQVGDAIQPSHPLLSLLLLLPIPPSIRVFSNESTLRVRWPKYWSFSFSISPSNEHP